MVIYIFVVHSVLLVIRLAKWICTVCEWIYDEEVEGAPFEQLPEDWICPSCGVDKSLFEKLP
jgi:rubredoxin